MIFIEQIRQYSINHQSPFPILSGSATQILILQAMQSYHRPSSTLSSMMFSLTVFIHVFNGLLFRLHPPLTYQSKHFLIVAIFGLLCTWPNQVKCLSLILCSMDAIPKYLLIMSFIILSLWFYHTFMLTYAYLHPIAAVVHLAPLTLYPNVSTTHRLKRGTL